MQKTVAVIPARYNSSRFPGKPLALLKGKFVIQHVYENVSCAKLVDSVFVATDDERIINAVQSFGGKALMTSIEHESGTDSMAEAAEKIDCDYVINVQGDEPFIRPGWMTSLNCCTMMIRSQSARLRTGSRTYRSSCPRTLSKSS